MADQGVPPSIKGDLNPTSPNIDEKQQSRRVVEIRRVESTASDKADESGSSTPNIIVMRRPPLSISPRPRSLILPMEHRRSPYFLTHSPTASYESSEILKF
jgi:hypothetical protein